MHLAFSIRMEGNYWRRQEALIYPIQGYSRIHTFHTHPQLRIPANQLSSELHFHPLLSHHPYLPLTLHGGGAMCEGHGSPPKIIKGKQSKRPGSDESWSACEQCKQTLKSLMAMIICYLKLMQLRQATAKVQNKDWVLTGMWCGWSYSTPRSQRGTRRILNNAVIDKCEG